MAERFLIVDDHPLSRGSSARDPVRLPRSRDRGSILLAAAKEVLSADEHFDLLLLDLTMPGTRGFDGLIETQGGTAEAADRHRLRPG